MRRFVGQCLGVARRDASLQRSYGFSGVIGLAAGLLGLLSYHFVGRLVGGSDAAALPGGTYFAFVWVGVMVQILVASTLGALGGALAREAAEGTLEAHLAAGASPLVLVVGATLVPAMLAGAQIALYATAGSLLFGIDLAGARVGPLLVATALTLIACAPIGLVGAAAWLLLRRAGLVTTAALFAFGVVGGVYFPVALLPEPVAVGAAWVPFTAGLDAVRGALLEGAGWAEIAPALLRLGIVAALSLPLATAALLAAIRRAERRGHVALV